MTKAEANKSNKPIAHKATLSSSPNNRKAGGRGSMTAEMRIFYALAHFTSLGQAIVPRKEVMQMADMTNKQSFQTMSGTAKRKGFVEFPDSSTMKLTETGIEKVGHAAVEPKSNKEVQDVILSKMKNKKTREMFETLTDGEWYSYPDLATSIGYDVDAGSFKTYVGGLSKYTEKSTTTNGTKLVRLTDIAFPKGRPSSD